MTEKGNKFLENWNPENSNRETRKLTRKIYREYFPADPDLKKKWTVAVRRANFSPSRFSKLCAKHFTEDCFEVFSWSERRPTKLKPGSIPTVFDFTTRRPIKPVKGKNSSKARSSKLNSRSAIYDNRGRLVKHGLRNVCDCLDEGCPGCHLPCPRCSSGKCGQECRINRRWLYESVEIEGKDVIMKNKYK